MSLERMPELGSKPVSLSVKLSAVKKIEDHLSDGIRELYRRGEFTDVALVCADLTYYAHRAVLVAQSEVFKEGLRTTAVPVVKEGAAEAKQEVRLADVSNPEAVKIMLDHMYQMESDLWEQYNPRTQEINKDVLHLAKHFGLPSLTERATHWLSKDITTANVVERLQICDDYGLQELGERILEQLTYNKTALANVAASPQIMKYPKLMQALLQQAAAVPDDSPQLKKKGRKCA